MEKINCFGDFCPVPLLKAKNKFSSLKPGQSFMLVTDHSCVVESLHDYFQSKPVSIDFEEAINGVWEITITRY